MVFDNVFGFNHKRSHDDPGLKLLARVAAGASRHLAQFWCGLHGHATMLHFQPDRLSLQCPLCGYETGGWEVGRPMTARRQANNPQARPERRRTLRPLPSKPRLAS
jgi:hypothetical protein